MAENALVLFSGGQDSTVCLAWALDRFDRVETIGFDYGQRHLVELDCRGIVRDRMCRAFPEWAPRLGDDHLVDLDRKSTRLNSSHQCASRMTSHAMKKTQITN